MLFKDFVGFSWGLKRFYRVFESFDRVLKGLKWLYRVFKGLNSFLGLSQVFEYGLAVELFIEYMASSAKHSS